VEGVLVHQCPVSHLRLLTFFAVVGERLAQLGKMMAGREIQIASRVLANRWAQTVGVGATNPLHTMVRGWKNEVALGIE